MLNIDHFSLENLGFDFDAALQQFTEAKRQHALTVDVPAPTAHPWVEAAFAAGGFQVMDPPTADKASVPPPLPPPPANPLNKAQALERLNKLQGKAVGPQLDGLRELLIQMFESMPG